MAVIRELFCHYRNNAQKFPTSNDIFDWIGFTANYSVGKSINRENLSAKKACYSITMTIFKGLSKNTPIIIII
jgi:hypothetical protein